MNEVNTLESRNRSQTPKLPYNFFLVTGSLVVFTALLSAWLFSYSAKNENPEAGMGVVMVSFPILIMGVILLLVSLILYIFHMKKVKIVKSETHIAK